MGGFFLTLFIVAGIFSGISPLFAQTGPAPDLGTAISPETQAASPLGTNLPSESLSDESSIILGEPAPSAVTAAGPSSVFVVLRMVLVLALAALAIYGVVFFIKRITKPRESRDPHLKVLARVPLSSDSYAAVLSIGPKAWLVGGGSGGVNMISEIDDAETLETMLLDDARRSAETGARGFFDFRSLFRRLGGRSKDPQAGHFGGEVSGRFETDSPDSLAESGSLTESLRKQRERLRGL